VWKTMMSYETGCLMNSSASGLIYQVCYNGTKFLQLPLTSSVS